MWEKICFNYCKKGFLEIAGGIFLTGIGLVIVGNSNNIYLMILGFLFIATGIALLVKD